MTLCRSMNINVRRLTTLTTDTVKLKMNLLHEIDTLYIRRFLAISFNDHNISRKKMLIKLVERIWEYKNKLYSYTLKLGS